MKYWDEGRSEAEITQGVNEGFGLLSLMGLLGLLGLLGGARA
jgi:hypothetical protein